MSTKAKSSIIRVSKNRRNPYVMINKEAIENPELTWEARGVLAYLLAKPDDWQVRLYDLVSQGPGGRDRMRRILKELEAQGYLERKRVRLSDGIWDWESTVYEWPIQPITEDSN